VTQVIKAFISFKHNGLPKKNSDRGRLIPTESDLLLSALEPFHGSETIRVKLYDLESPDGRLMGFLNSVSETPAVIIAGEHSFGLVNAKNALERIKRTKNE
jgi:hypothetical protein